MTTTTAYKLLTSKEVRTLLGISSSQFYSWRKHGIFPPGKEIASNLYWTEDQLQSFLADSPTKSAAKRAGNPNPHLVNPPKWIDFQISEWAASMPNHFNLTSKDLADMAGVNPQTILAWARQGAFPKPTQTTKAKGRLKYFWNLGVLRAWITNRDTKTETTP